MNSLLVYSKELLKAVRDKTETDPYLKNLAEIEYTELANQLTSDTDRKAFWINIYNAYYQILFVQLGLRRPHIFTKQVMRLAGKDWSLDDIEHGILRKYRYKYSLGYFPQLFPSQRIKNNAVQTIDYRIHFALNCGAVSCPPIAFYSADNLEDELNQASQAFIETETIINSNNKSVTVNRILFWFMKDFGGLKGIRSILKNRLNTPLEGYNIRFNQYSWDEKLNNFV